MTQRQVRVLRERLMMTREQFARVLRVTTRTIYRWEAGESRPQVRHLQRLRRLLRRVDRGKER